LRIRIDAAGRLPRPSDLLMDQMRAIDNGRLVKGPLLRLSSVQMKQIASAFLELIGIET
jgi:mRNA interferase MazF